MKNILTFSDLVEFLNLCQYHRNRLCSTWDPETGRRPKNYTINSMFFAVKEELIIRSAKEAFLLNIQECFSIAAFDDPNKTCIEGITFDPKLRVYTQVYNHENSNGTLPEEFVSQRLAKLINLYNDFYHTNARFYPQDKRFDPKEFFDCLNTHRNWLSELLRFIFGSPKSKNFIEGYGLFSRMQSIIDNTPAQEHQLQN